MATNLEFINNLPGHILSSDLDTTQGKLWKIFSLQFDEIDVIIQQMRIINVIRKVGGQNLDRIGGWIGQTRDGLDDATYRSLLDVAVVDEEVDLDHIVTVARLLLRAEEFQVLPDFPAGFFIDAQNPNPLITLPQISSLINGLWHFARRVTIVVHSGADAFAFFDDPEGKGFDDDTAPGTGGNFAFII